MFSIYNQMSRLTIHVRLTGTISLEEMERFALDYRRVTDSYQGESHLVLADMRGLKTCTPPVANVLMDVIGYARRRGVAACAHLSDDTVTRLQMLRLARQVSEKDDVTIDVVSLEEAESVLSERRFELRVKGGPRSSRSAPLSSQSGPRSSERAPASYPPRAPAGPRGSSPPSSPPGPISSLPGPGSGSGAQSGPVSPRT